MIQDSATRLAKRIKEGELTPLDAVDMYVDRATSVNNVLNAIVVERFEQARDEAKAAEKITSKSQGRLHGVPITIKEMISVEGMPVTAGSTHRSHAVAYRDATIVRRLKDEGAIIIGVTNQSELGLWWESNNPVYGRTKNPHNIKRTSGGSSGGEGASVAAATSAVGIGSDMGGSVRLPAMFCGVYGHKPSGGIVPITGHFPLDLSNARMPTAPDARLIAIGPIARHPEDLELLFDIIRGPCDEDHNSRRPATSLTKPRRAFILADPIISKASRTSNAQREATMLAGEILANAGMQVTELDSKFFIDAFDVYAGVLGSIEGAIENIIAGEHGMSLVREATRFARKKSKHTAPAWLAVFGERLLTPGPKAVKRAVARKSELMDELTEMLGDDGVLIMPTFPTTAPRHQTTLLRPFDIASTAIFNALELPVTAAPVGLAPDGMPTGVQIVGAMDRDALTLAVARILHESTGGSIPPVIE